MKNIGSILKQAQKIQEQMAKIQGELALKTVEATSGGGMVVAVVNGQQEVVSIRIEKQVVEAQDVEMLQDLVVAAVNQALKKSREMVAEEMRKVTGGLEIPGLTF